MEADTQAAWEADRDRFQAERRAKTPPLGEPSADSSPAAGHPHGSGASAASSPPCASSPPYGSSPGDSLDGSPGEVRQLELLKAQVATEQDTSRLRDLDAKVAARATRDDSDPSAHPVPSPPLRRLHRMCCRSPR